MAKTSVFHVRVSAELSQKIKGIAKAAGVTVSEWIRAQLSAGAGKCPTCGGGGAENDAS